MSIPNKMPPFDNNRYVSAYSEGAKAADKEWAEWFEKFWLECNIGRCKYKYRGCDNKIDNCKAWQERRKEIVL
jgi:hypothetical protein